jgi:glycosyltransferase involved in cell wall biosynthesis
VVDDGSEDQTATRAREAGAAVARQANAGAAAARRAGFSRVMTDLVVFLDADDALVAEGVAASIREISAASRPTIAGGRTLGVLDGGGTRQLARWGRVVTFDDLLTRRTSPGPPSAFVWPTEIMARALDDRNWPGLWPRYAEDYELLIRGSQLAPIVCHDEVSVRYSMVGGKSAVDPLNSLRCADRIRIHYASAAGLEASPMSERQLRSRGALRNSWVAAAEGRRLRRVRGLFACFFLDPIFFAQLIMRKAASRVAER